jgi:sugar O-acyltransferase (sialic acid O-acetyltransferase NeuD family)
MNLKKEKNKKVLGLFGAGGHGREFMDTLIQLAEDDKLDFHKTNIYFIESQKIHVQVNNIPILSLDEFCELESTEKYFNISVSEHKKRQELANICLDRGLKPISLHADLSLIGANNQVGIGALISEFSIITTNIKIGSFLHLNRYASISHDCVIGDFVTFGPYASCNGNVIIEDGVYIGSGAIIKQGTKAKPLVIGKNSIIGMGAVVITDVPKNKTVVGNPAKILSNV